MAFGDHWEWRVLGDISNTIRSQIQQLTPKYASGVEVTDRYLWMPGCKVNVKVREQDLKFKYLLDKTDEGFEKWKEDEKDNFPFPLSPEIIPKLETALGTEFPKDLAQKSFETYQSLLDVLSRCIPPVICIVIEKFRTTYVYDPTESPEILVEVADIKSIEIDGRQLTKTLASVSLEGSQVNAMRNVRDTLGLPDALQVKGYLQLIEELVKLNS